MPAAPLLPTLIPGLLEAWIPGHLEACGLDTWTPGYPDTYRPGHPIPGHLEAWTHEHWEHMACHKEQDRLKLCYSTLINTSLNYTTLQ